MAFDLDPNYKQVPERIADFKALYPTGSLQPADLAHPYTIETIGDGGACLSCGGEGEITKNGKKVACLDCLGSGKNLFTFVVYTAAAYRTPDDPKPGIGCAWEPFPGLTPYTRKSELQNAETSAWGRAIVAVLASESKAIASAEDVRNRSAESASEQRPRSTRERAAAPMTGQDGEAISYVKLAPIDDRRDVAARFKSLPEDQRLALTETMREHKIPGPSQMSVEQVKFARALISAAAKTAVEGGYDYESALEDQRFEEAEARKATAPASKDDPDFQARLESVKGNDFKQHSGGEPVPGG